MICFYNNSTNNEARIYGALYTWEAAMNGTFDHKGDNANFWTATEYNNIRAWGRHIYSSYSSVHWY